MHANNFSTVLLHLWSSWHFLMNKIFNRCSYMDQEFLLLVAGFPWVCAWASHIYPCNFFMSFSVDQKYKFTFVEVGVYVLSVLPLNFDHCWLLLKIFHFSSISQEWRICAFESISAGSCWLRFTRISSIIVTLGLPDFLRCASEHLFSINYMHRYILPSVTLAICGSCDIRAVGMVRQHCLIQYINIDMYVQLLHSYSEPSVLVRHRNSMKLSPETKHTTWNANIYIYFLRVASFKRMKTAMKQSIWGREFSQTNENDNGELFKTTSYGNDVCFKALTKE